jgi:hypothetical protein
MPPELGYQIVMALISAGAVYGGIRADLKGMHERIKAAQDAATEAHRRLDIHIDKG